MSHVEVWSPSGVALERLEGERQLRVGREADNDIVLGWDRSVGRLHAAFEPYGSEWSIRDLGSRNGTFVGGERVHAERVLRGDDEITIGRARLVYRRVGLSTLTETATELGPPKVTPTERRVLVELCRPMLEGRQFRQPASVEQVGSALGIQPVTVKFHLKNLYRRFELVEGPGNRRVELANQALERRAVTWSELTAGSS